MSVNLSQISERGGDLRACHWWLREGTHAAAADRYRGWPVVPHPCPWGRVAVAVIPLRQTQGSCCGNVSALDFGKTEPQLWLATCKSQLALVRTMDWIWEEGLLHMNNFCSDANVQCTCVGAR